MCAPNLVLSPKPSRPSLDSKPNAQEYLLTPRIERADGIGPAFDLGFDHGDLLVVTMGINHVVEHEWLAVSIWGSVDGNDWGGKPLAALPQKCYCGIYSTFLDLSKCQAIRYLQVRWNMVRWGKGDPTPLFGFYISAQASGYRANV
jgi:hypothetical protein